jgi:hypothetical protein
MLDSLGSKLALVCVIGLVIVLIGVGIQTDVFSILNKDKSQNILSIGDLNANPKQHAGQKITVQGYFLEWDLPIGDGYITSELLQPPIIEGSLNDVDFIIANISGVTTSINDSVLYDFTGIWVSQGIYPTISYTLSIEKIEPV